MSQTYDPNSPEHGPEYGQGYASGPGWAGSASAPPLSRVDGGSGPPLGS